MIELEPRFIQGIIPFTGAGYTKPVLLAGASFTVAAENVPRRCTFVAATAAPK